MKTMTKADRPKTQVEFLRELISTHKFFIVDKGSQIAEGYIVTVINPEEVLVDICREGDTEPTTHYLPFTAMGWDEFTQTGFVFGSLPEAP